MARKKRIKRLDTYPKDKNFAAGVERTRVTFYGTEKKSYSKPPPGPRIATKGSLGSIVMREEMRLHTGSYNMARRGPNALLDHPKGWDKFNKFKGFVRQEGKAVNEHNLQVKIEVNNGVQVQYDMYCMHAWVLTKPFVHIYLSVPTNDDPNFRIVEVIDGKARRSEGFGDKLKCVNAFRYNRIRWVKG